MVLLAAALINLKSYLFMSQKGNYVVKYRGRIFNVTQIQKHPYQIEKPFSVKQNMQEIHSPIRLN